jgi:hypothetical protein
MNRTGKTDQFKVVPLLRLSPLRLSLLQPFPFAAAANPAFQG